MTDTIEYLNRLEAVEQIISMMKDRGLEVNERNRADVERIVHYHYSPSIALYAQMVLQESKNGYDFTVRLNNKVVSYKPRR